MAYTLIDSGGEQKFERFGSHTLVRPCSQAVWGKTLSESKWNEADAIFGREEGSRWKKKKIPESWEVEFSGLQFKLMGTDFGHLGLFPEHQMHWEWMSEGISGKKVLNLFAYTGAATLALAKAGAAVCHVDASKGIVSWARENAKLSQLEDKPIRWIVDDAIKFLKREVKRGSHYDGVLLDPPTFGRGAQGQVFKLESEILPLLALCREVLTPDPSFLLLTSHTPGFTPQVLSNLLTQALPKGGVESGEMILEAEKGLPLPTGTYAGWRP